MKEIIENYGQAILTFISILALIGIIVWLLIGENSPVSKAFLDLIDGFFGSASDTAGIMQQPTT